MTPGKRQEAVDLLSSVAEVSQVYVSEEPDTVRFWAVVNEDDDDAMEAVYAKERLVLRAALPKERLNFLVVPSTGRDDIVPRDARLWFERAPA